MSTQPFVTLSAPRVVNRPELPTELAKFYSLYEGVGLGSDCSVYPIRFCKLSEVAVVTWKGLGLVGDIPDGWYPFVGILIAIGKYFEQIVFVLNAPCSPPGSILAIGSNISGQVGGTGPYALESALVLATTFPEWIAHLERWGWQEYALLGFGDQPISDWEELFRYYAALNPGMGTVDQHIANKS